MNALKMRFALEITKRNMTCKNFCWYKKSCHRGNKASFHNLLNLPSMNTEPHIIAVRNQAPKERSSSSNHTLHQ